MLTLKTPTVKKKCLRLKKRKGDAYANANANAKLINANAKLVDLLTFLSRISELVNFSSFSISYSYLEFTRITMPKGIEAIRTVYSLTLRIPIAFAWRAIQRALASGG